MINVIGGKYRSRQLETPTSGTLPTKNMVRGALFSALGDISGASVLDLFAGSGALGIEALSRGAAYATFVDSSKEAVSVIKNNLTKLKEEHGLVLFLDAMKALEKLSTEKRVYDVVFLDPPYANKAIYQQALNAMLEYGMLSSGAKIILEYEGELPLDDSHFTARRDYRYGKSKLIYLRKE